MRESMFTYKGRPTYKVELGDVGTLVGAADQEFNETVVVDVNGTLKTISSKPGIRAVREGNTGGKWHVVRYGRSRVALRPVSS
jgi:hypothetical protein